MKRQKHSFYQPNPLELQEQKIKDIYQLISRQQKSISELMSKYQDERQEEQIIFQDKKQVATTIDREGESRKDREFKLQKRSNTKISKYVQLPQINKSKLTNRQSGTKKVTSLMKSPYVIELQNQKEKQKIKSSLQKLSFGSRDDNNRTKRISPLKSRRSSKKINQNRSSTIQTTRMDIQNQSQSAKNNEDEQKPNQIVIPQPLPYYKPIEQNQQDSSSDQGEVPLTYYQKQYREIMKGQCLQEVNFLYFSKNESMKDWTEGVLTLFQKHDKQLMTLRNKCKYLTKFDTNFFSIDIFRES